MLRVTFADAAKAGRFDNAVSAAIEKDSRGFPANSGGLTGCVMPGHDFSQTIVAAARTSDGEVKATNRIEDVGLAQLLNYLQWAGGGVGLLANFGLRPEIKRYVMGDPMNRLPRLSKALVQHRSLDTRTFVRSRKPG